MKSLLFTAALIFTANFAQAEVVKTSVAQAVLPANPHKKAEASISSDSDGTLKMAKVYFVTPKNGETVSSKFKVKMGLEGMKIRPAGEAPSEVTSGHHHLIIDGKATPAGVPVPADATNLHYGKGQTETEVTLAPGDHTLTLQFADGAHRSFGEKMSATIKIKVK